MVAGVIFLVGFKDPFLIYCGDTGAVVYYLYYQIVLLLLALKDDSTPLRRKLGGINYKI